MSGVQGSARVPFCILELSFHKQRKRHQELCRREARLHGKNPFQVPYRLLPLTAEKLRKRESQEKKRRARIKLRSLCNNVNSLGVSALADEKKTQLQSVTFIFRLPGKGG